MIKNLKLLRQERHISQQQLANAVGISQQSINKYENHDVEPDITLLISIADFFNTSVDYLIGHSNVDRKQEAFVETELTAEELQFIQKIRQLSPIECSAIDTVINVFLSKL